MVEPSRRVEFRNHADVRMQLRGITEEEVYAVVDYGEIIETYPQDTPFPSRLVLGWIGQRPLHVVMADDPETDTIIVITTYKPDPERWLPGFRRRRKR